MILRLALMFSIMLLFAKMILMAASYMAGEANDPGNLTPVDAVVVERNRLAGMQAEERVAEAQIALANAIVKDAVANGQIPEIVALIAYLNSLK